MDCSGNDCFSGYAVDLLKLLAAELKFTYVLSEAPDGKYGSQNPVTGEWDGMVKQLLPNKQGITVSA